jgi:hypothetical protein
MKIANIYPVKNQRLYKCEDFVMILAHLVQAGMYSKYNFNNEQFIIMDNGAFEGMQVSTSLQACIDLAEQSGIPIKEIIIPDIMGDAKKTRELFEGSIETIKKWQHKYQFMFVAHASCLEEFTDVMNYINSFDLNLTVGIPKALKFERNNYVMTSIYLQCKFPIHFLGIKASFMELRGLKNIIRSCDTSQLAYIAKNVQRAPESVYTFVRDRSLYTDIDLMHDKCNSILLRALKKQSETEMKSNGIL